MSVYRDNDICEVITTIVILGAGLPNLLGKITEARTYAERLFLYRTIGQLDEKSAADALTVPICRLGASITERALSALLTGADGYPFFLQTYGRAAWDITSGKIINEDDARLAIEYGTLDLDFGFFQAGWQRATPAERKYLRAMAQDGEVSSLTDEVAARLGKSRNKLAVIRSRLISKGVVYAPEYGLIQFTVPGMARFIDRQIED